MDFLRNNENYAAWFNQVGPVIGGVAGSISTGIGDSSVGGGNQSVSGGGSNCPCQYAPAPILGCTTAGSLNYNPNANQDDGSCIAPVSGCTDPSALNYNPSANVDCNGNVLGGASSGPANTGPTVGFDGRFYNAGGCGSYSNFNQQGFGGYNDKRGSYSNFNQQGFGGYNDKRGSYSNFNQQGFGGYNDKMWFND